MQRTKVESSQIESIGYDNEQQILEVCFHGKTTLSVYRYYKVDADTHAAMMKAESKGIFLGQRIKGVFMFEKIETFDKPVPEPQEVVS